MKFKTLVASATITAVGLASAALAQEQNDEVAGVTLGNGEANWIIAEGVKRSADTTYTEQRITADRAAVRRGDGTTLTFSEVHIESDGWLVVHPFISGMPNGEYVAGYTFVESGTNADVAVTLNPAPKSGEMLLVMLHSDSNSDRVFDFVFVDDTNVADRAVFEGNRMIAHVFEAP